MNIFYETIEKFKDFNSRINIKIEQQIPEFSMLGNIISSYDNVLDDKLKLENKNYIELREKLNLVKQEVKDKRNIVKQLEPLIVNFQEAYKKKYGEVELQSISQKAFIRIKKEELKNYLIIYDFKLKEKEELESKKANINSEIMILKDRIAERCQKYIDEVNVKNIEDLKSDIADISGGFARIPPGNLEISSDYVSSEEYLNSTSEYKDIYKKLYTFMSGIFEATQKFIDNANIEKVIPDLVVVQNELKEKYNDIYKLDREINKINDFTCLKESYEEALSNAEKELENINGLADRNEELLIIKVEIENYINKNQIV